MASKLEKQSKELKEAKNELFFGGIQLEYPP
jgi:hypothetical protein